MISPESTLSFTKWKLISMCIVLSWKTGLEAVCSATWLSQISFIDLTFSNLNCWSNCFSHESSLIVAAIARYFTLDLATIFGFLLRHEIKFSPMSIEITWSGPFICWWTCPISLIISLCIGYYPYFHKIILYPTHSLYT